jgi:TRAP-type C4-dicarboxylate transport system permease small subunit
VKRAVLGLSRLLEWLAAWLAASAMGVMLLCMLVQVIARYGFAQPPGWTEELARYAMIWGAFAGASLACRRRLDPALVRIRDFRSPGIRLLARSLEALSITSLSVVILWAAGATLALQSQLESEALPLSGSSVLIVIPVTFAVLLVHVLALLIEGDEVNESDAPV